MPKAPGYLDSNTPVLLKPRYQEGITVRADPDDFGAAIGRSMQRVAGGMGQLADAATQAQQMKDNAVANDVQSKWLTAKDDLLYGEGGYATLQGRAAVEGYEAYKTRVTGLKRTLVGEMSPAQAKIFSEKIADLERDALRTGVIKRAEETKSFVIQEHVAAADNFARQAAQSPLDIERWETFIGRGLMEIEERGKAEGWGDEKSAQAVRDFVSTARKDSALQLAIGDPVAALKYATDHADELSSQDHMVLLERLKPDVSAAVAREAAGFSASKPAPNHFAAQGLNRDTYALLSVIAGTESPGYDVLNGGQRFKDFAAHPGIVGAGGPSTAAGRYQFIKGTYALAAQALGLTDFSPASQDRAAAWLAQRDYRARTGRDLNQDVAAGNYAAVKAGLGPTWEGIAKMSDADFAKKMSMARSAPVQIGNVTVAAGSVPSAPAGQPLASPQLPPHTEALLQRLPQAYADEIRQSSIQGVRSYEAQQAASQKAIQTAQTDRYKLRIANGDTSLTTDVINDDTVIDDGDKAALINSLNEKNKSVLETQRNVEAFQAGRFVVDPYSDSGRKANDEVWGAISSQALPQQRNSLLMSQINQTGAVPTSVVNAMRADLSSGSNRNVVNVLQLAGRIATVDPAALSRTTGGKEISDDASLFTHFTRDMGISPEVAAQRIIDRKDPEKTRARAALMESKPIKQAIDAQATESKVRSIFSTGLFSSNPALGTSELQSAAIVSDYADYLKEAIFDAGGDVDAGKALAADRFKRVYGTSDFSIGGPKVVTRLPPEKTYPSDANGSWGYIREQLTAGLVAEGISASTSYLVPDRDTERDVSSGVPPRYQVYYQDTNGVLQHFRKPFYAKAPTAAEIATAKKADAARKIAELEAQRQQNIQELEAGRDREANLDAFLAGPPQLPHPSVASSSSSSAQQR